MIFVMFFALVFALVGGAAVLGFLLAIYAFRPHRLGDVLAVLKGSDYEDRAPNLAGVGLLIAAFLPIVAGFSYAVSGAKWFVDIFGEAGTNFWIWVGCAFAFGFLLGLILRSEQRH
jgi:hypothetical protein